MNEKSSIDILNQDTNPNTQYYIKTTDFIDFSKLGCLIIDNRGNSRKGVTRTISDYLHSSYNDINMSLSKFIYDFYDMLTTQYEVDVYTVIMKNFYGWNLTIGDNYISASYKDIYESKVEFLKDDKYTKVDDPIGVAYETASVATDGLIFANWVLTLIRDDDEIITDKWLGKLSVALHNRFIDPSEKIYRIDGLERRC
jgi:hypothetical protein